MDENYQKSDEEVRRDFFKTLTWYFEEKTTYTGFLNTVGDIRDKLQVLNENLERTNESSTRLSSALNRITFWGLIIGGAGVLVALGHLVLEICKYWKG